MKTHESSLIYTTQFLAFYLSNLLFVTLLGKYVKIDRLYYYAIVVLATGVGIILQ